METTTILTTPSEEIYAEFIAAPASSMSPSAIAEHMQQNQITFEIPTAHDLRHIDALHSSAAAAAASSSASSASSASAVSSYLFNFNSLLANDDSNGNSMSSISTEQLSKSVVLDLADLRDQTEHADSWWSDIFGDADMNVIINYLWIGVVSSLVILSLVFIIFSCYFYRKFRTWKKCNKDIRAQIHASNDSYSSHGVSHHLISCDASRLLLQQQQQQQQQHQQQQHLSSGNNEMEAAFYQIESPPCYTIATGLPSYDEALHHQPRHFAYGMKFVYPSLAAVHHHHHHHQAQAQAQSQAHAQARICNWEKDELQQHKLQKCKLSASVAVAAASGQEEDKANATASNSVSVLPSAICINMPDEPKQQQQEEQRRQQQQQHQQQQQEVATLQPAAAADDDCASLVVVVSA